MNKHRLPAFSLALALLLTIVSAVARAQTNVTVVLPDDSASVEKIAAEELASHLRILYPQTAFDTSSASASSSGATIYMGTAGSLPARFASQVKSDLTTPDSYAIKVIDENTAVIAGSNPRAVLYAVYALLEKLGFGFYISYSTEPAPASTPFSFSGWELRDAPVVGERAVLNWYNFLSGCSTWNLEDWQHWITQASRMRFNTIMVHAYGNNPVFNFSHNGQTMPTGYLNNTKIGRDNGTEHVLDVRKIVGAGDLFTKPVFGADISLDIAPDSERVQAAVNLMQKVFKFAADRGMGISFGIDGDTETDNPQNIIATLPASARFTASGAQLANPDTPEGYAYYRAQIEHLMTIYPEVTQVAIWFRGQVKGKFSSPWRLIQPKEFPDDWAKEYKAALEKNPAMRRDPEAPSMFALGKMAAAYRKALDETGHPGVTVAAGTWRFDYMNAADAFMPAGVELIPLDYSHEFLSDPIQKNLREVGKRRPVTPVVWVQHDDCMYAGRSYTPYAGFGSALSQGNNSGFAIIHWMTRPHDLYFKNTCDQTWASTLNETLDATASKMAANTFGAGARAPGSRYLLDWIYDAPAFGEETTDKTFYNQTVDAERAGNAAIGSARRLALLADIKPLAKTQSERDWVEYYENWEHYAQGVLNAQSALQDSYDAQEAGDIEQARKAIERADPVSALEAFGRAARLGPINRGEKGLLISLNLRWLPYFKAQRVALGMDPLVVKFAPTYNDALSKAPGHYTFDFDGDHQPILVLGTLELGTKTEVRDSGSAIKSPVELAIGNIGKTTLPDGTYTMTLTMPPDAKVQIKPANGSATETQTATSTTRIQIKSKDGQVHFTLSPVEASQSASTPAQVSGVILKLQN